MLFVCDHEPGVPTPNLPALDRACRKCGLSLVRTERDVGLEREITRRATDAWKIDVTGLIAFSEHRADKGPVRALPTRDFRTEMLEEFADARNYACWELQQLRMRADDGDDVGEQIDQAMQALRAAALGFAALT